MRPKNQDYQNFFELDLAGIYQTSIDGDVIECNDTFARILGYKSSEDLAGKGAITYCNNSDRETVIAALRSLGTISNLEVCLRKKDGTPVWVFENMTLRTALDGKPIVVGVLLEITEQRMATERMQHQVYHDPLTGLPNQALFKDRLNVGIAHARHEGRQIGVMFVDLDHFELINTTFGHGIGDRLLQGLADRLSETRGPEETVARHGSDEFTILFSSDGGAEQAALLAQQVLDTISKPFVLDQQNVYVNASIGIALFPDEGEDAETLLKNADAAMYRAKDKGRNIYQLFTPAMNARAFERLALVTSLKRALDKGEFLLHFQPEVNVQTGRITCIGALLRWNHPDLGIIEPADFIVAAEDASLIIPIGEWVLREACRQAKQWQAAGLPVTKISVNLSTGQLFEQQIEERIERILRESGLQADVLQLEISEDSIGDPVKSLAALRGLKELGVGLTLDNFGIGRSSLTDLKHLPLDSVKIDRSFIQGMTRRADDAAIVSAIIAIARGLNLRVIAEGVETLDQLSFLRDRHCSEMQGYFFGKPHPATTVAEMLRMQGH